MQILQFQGIMDPNLWGILISLCNLVILFLILRHFLFKPVNKVMRERKQMLEDQFTRAENAEQDADKLKAQWQEKMDGADSAAAAIMANANENAQKRSEAILAETKTRADGILRQAEADALLERKKAEAGIKKELVDLSTVLSEKLLEREINPDDHRALIDSFIADIGEQDERDE